MTQLKEDHLSLAEAVRILMGHKGLNAPTLSAMSGVKRHRFCQAYKGMSLQREDISAIAPILLGSPLENGVEPRDALIREALALRAAQQEQPDTAPIRTRRATTPRHLIRKNDDNAVELASIQPPIDPHAGQKVVHDWVGSYLESVGRSSITQRE